MTRRATLTPEQLDRIADLTERRRLSAGRIAQMLDVSVGAVAWARLRIGADKHPTKVLPPVPTQPVVRMRGGRPVRAFVQAEDELLLSLEAQGLGDFQIGRRLDPPRRSNSVRGRLMTLARRQARAEAAASASADRHSGEGPN